MADESTPKPENKDKTEYEKQVDKELAKLAEYHKALTQEFANIDPDDPEVIRKANEKIIELVPDAGAALNWLLNHAQSESVRANIAKYVFDRAIKHASEKGEDDEIAKLLKGMTKVG